MERSITVRAFGIPDKEMGAMLHGYNDPRNFHYSIGSFNGDGQNFKNADNNFDLMMRGWVAPASFLGDGPLHDATIGGSSGRKPQQHAGRWRTRHTRRFYVPQLLRSSTSPTRRR